MTASLWALPKLSNSCKVLVKICKIIHVNKKKAFHSSLSLYTKSFLCTFRSRMHTENDIDHSNLGIMLLRTASVLHDTWLQNKYQLFLTRVLTLVFRNILNLQSRVEINVKLHKKYKHSSSTWSHKLSVLPFRICA